MAFREDDAHQGSSPAARASDPLVGTLINGKFRVDRAIARGGMGRIYYGTQAPLDRPVALKIVKADSIDEQESQFLKRFLLEASILAKLQHPNIVTLFDYGRIEGAPVEMYFIAMEYLSGQTLTERLRNEGAISAYEALILFRQIARGLREAHARGIVHRDLKPSNIMILPEADGSEIVKLVDFGIGKIERSGEDLTADGVVVGTPKYMAPEQFEGTASPASDVYALGTIMYQLVVGALPFPGNTMAEVMVAKMAQEPRPMREVNPICDAPESVERMVLKMLARVPEERASLDEVFALLSMCEAEIFGVAGARLATTGSSPILGGSGAISRPSGGLLGPASSAQVDALKVPYTIFAPTPTPRGSSTNNPLLMTGFTPRPMSTSAYPSTSATAKKGVPVMALVTGISSLVAFGAVGLFVVKSRTPPAPAASTSAPPPLVTASAPKAFVLHIASTPPGAAVSEDGVVLGVTPVDVKIEPSSVADRSRSFEVRKDGFAGATLSQGPSEGNVDKTVVLAPEAAHTVQSPRGHGPSGGRQPGTGGRPPSTQPDDIKLRR